ncbi:MAG TPA: class I SAM-dependent methyltransferase [Actinomycetota bacterium]|nr:class I SAM-dependent methyltransferase [Actinomycetota bacterium]
MKNPGYGRDLAEVHHHGYGWAATGAAQILTQELERRGLGRGRIVDLGCGSGILARLMTERNYDVVGLDRAREMLRIARREAPRARFLHGSVVDFERGPKLAGRRVFLASKPKR